MSKMPEKTICLTCDTSTATELYELKSMYTKMYPEKQLLDLLKEFIEIDPNMACEAQLPQHLCGDCMQKLNNAYEFVMQARDAYKRLLEKFKPELKLDMVNAPPLEQFVAVKLEPAGDDMTPVEFAETLLKEHESDQDCDDDMQQDYDIFDKGISESSASEKEHDYYDDDDDPLTLMKQRKRKALLKQTDMDIDDSNVEDLNNSSDDNDDDEDDEPLLKRKIKLQKTKHQHKQNTLSCNQCSKTFRLRRSLNAHKQKHHPKINGETHACPQCKRKFSRKDSLQVHLRTIHAPNDGTPQQHIPTISERKKAKELDLNLCKPHGCKLIQCMICLQHFAKISDLHSHLKEHPEIDIFGKRTDTLQEIAESFYPDMKEDVTEAALLARLRKDLKSKKYVYFYSITNQAGYELRLESSDTDGDDENTVRKNNFYACDLCTKTKFRRRYQLFEHQREKHSWEEAQHICRRCDARFLSKKVLDHHYESQCRNSQKRFLCNRCPLRFRWKQNLKAHYAEHKNMVQTNICEQCNRSFKDKKSLSTHLHTVHTDASNLLPCKWCNRLFYRYENLLKHFKRHGLRERDLPLAEVLLKATINPNGAKRIICKVCELKFERISDLKAHILMELKLNLSAHHKQHESLPNYSITSEAGFELHLDDSETDNEETSATSTLPSMPYKCEICQVQCRRRYEMFQHQRAMHAFEPLPHNCTNCIFKTVSKNILEHHERTHCQNKEKQLSCKHCSYKFIWPENLEQHQQMEHADGKSAISGSIAAVNGAMPTEAMQPEQKSASTTELLNCPHCDRTYMHQSRLNNHIRDVHGEGSEANKKKKKESERKFLCSHCGKEEPSASRLLTHVRRHTGERPFKCDMCEMAFARHVEMMIHRRKHTGEKPYHCTVCGKDFARSDKLKRHTLIHSGLKPYKCSLCEKSYRQAKDLKLHMQQHTGETPFECTSCGERFIERVALEKHRIMRGHFDEIQ